jgi:hypothetical protein
VLIKYDLVVQQLRIKFVQDPSQKEVAEESVTKLMANIGMIKVTLCVQV